MAGVIARKVIQKLTLRSKVIAQPIVLKRFFEVDAWVYRGIPKDPPNWHHVVAKGFNGFVWWWILTHCWYQFDHLVGEFPAPDGKKWTNGELGVTEDF